MKLEQQITSLELSQRLEKLGVKQESAFYWVKDSALGTQLIPYGVAGWDNGWSAFTAAELGEMLPWRSKRMDTINNAELVITILVNSSTDWRSWTVAYWDEDKSLYDGMVVRFSHQNESEARGLMLEYLITNDLVSV